MVAVEPSDTGAAARVGDFFWQAEDRAPVTSVAEPELAGLLTADARAALRQGRGGSREHVLSDGRRVQAFVDVILPPRSLLICGAGYDAVPLARLGKELGWRVRVVDGRKALRRAGTISGGGMNWCIAPRRSSQRASPSNPARPPW